MKRYILKLVFEVSVDGSHQHFDEQLRFFSSGSAGEALEEANALGQAEEQQLVNAAGARVSWMFAGVTEMINITDSGQGSMLFSVSSYQDDHESYSRFIALKAIAVRRKNPIFA